MNEPVLSKPDERGVVLFTCPGCGYCHGVWTNPAKPNEMTKAHWRWNGDRHKLTQLQRPHFGPEVVEVLAIDVTQPLTRSTRVDPSA